MKTVIKNIETARFCLHTSYYTKYDLGIYHILYTVILLQAVKASKTQNHDIRIYSNICGTYYIN